MLIDGNVWLIDAASRRRMHHEGSSIEQQQRKVCGGGQTCANTAGGTHFFLWLDDKCTAMMIIHAKWGKRCETRRDSGMNRIVVQVKFLKTRKYLSSSSKCHAPDTWFEGARMPKAGFLFPMLSAVSSNDWAQCRCFEVKQNATSCRAAHNSKLQEFLKSN